MAQRFVSCASGCGRLLDVTDRPEVGDVSLYCRDCVLEKFPIARDHWLFQMSER